MKRPTATVICVALLAFASAANAAESPYAGQEKRAIKALSEQEIKDYLNGSGMGTSKAAELNHYPGPRHVLDEAVALGLSAEQTSKVREVHAGMQSDARRIGSQIVEKEAELESLFANQHADADNVRKVVTTLAILQADFRLVHLNAHLRMHEILSPEQIAMYDKLRGYGSNKSPGHGQGHGRHQ